MQNLKQVEFKYVATLHYSVEQPNTPDRIRSNRHSYSEHLQGDSKEKELQALAKSFLLLPYRGDGQPAEALTRMLTFVPEDRRPRKDIAEYLVSSDANLSIIGVPVPPSRQDTELLIYGSSPEVCEERVSAIVSVFDQGYSRPLQLACWRTREKRCNPLPQLEKQVEETAANHKKVAKELEQYSDYSPEMLVSLRLQQMELDTELAGVKARLTACDKILGGKASDERRRQVEEVKTAAEIELAGFEARRGKNAEFIGMVKTKTELIAKEKEANSKRAQVVSEINNTSRFASILNDRINAFAPVTIAENRVTIQPVKWTP